MTGGPAPGPPVLTAGPVSTIPEVVQRLVEIAAAVERPGEDAQGGVYWFTRLYLRITENIGKKVDEGRFFADNEFLTRLDVAFANRYLAALRGFFGPPASAPEVWRVLFAAPGDGSLLPVQLALAGVNAHINLDLSVAVVEAGRALGRPGIDWGWQKADYDKVNAVFAEEMDGILDELRQDPMAVGGRHRLSLLDQAATAIVALARQRAWGHAEQLWPLDRTSEAWRRIEGAMDEEAARLSRYILHDLFP